MNRRIHVPVLTAAVLCLVLATVPVQSAPATTQPQVSLSTTTEEGKKQLVATVTAAGKPVVGASVSFSVRRLFGNLLLGEDKTLDDGTAAVPFPTDLPGDAKGTLDVIAAVKASAAVGAATSEAKFPGGAIPTQADQAFPRALWAPHAPIGLIAAIVAFVGGVWITYAYVIFQLLRLKRGTRA